jgi:hypothetical protein
MIAGETILPRYAKEPSMIMLVADNLQVDHLARMGELVTACVLYILASRSRG